MSLGSFFKKQFVDVIHWTESGDGVLAYRYPMQDMEIQNDHTDTRTVLEFHFEGQ